MVYDTHIKGQKQTLYLGKQPWRINYAGVDRLSRQPVTGLTTTPDMANASKRTEVFARNFALKPR